MDLRFSPAFEEDGSPTSAKRSENKTKSTIKYGAHYDNNCQQPVQVFRSASYQMLKVSTKLTLYFQRK